MALKWFRQQNNMTGKPLWGDDTAKAFINTWAELDKSIERREFAVRLYETLK
ncbi:hypothetical protein HYR54_10295 [Candidatus Acetothermia bacterium]|nr:hypothetical protein [Candidatus Acetothermia bacterium]MBI3460001.1 hypothetical protein [Candidatus Acetothermia bacterium]MBI3660606.1 hypothetical protein [Candidatus Acetothermia bacterium]